MGAQAHFKTGGGEKSTDTDVATVMHSSLLEVWNALHRLGDWGKVAGVVLQKVPSPFCSFHNSREVFVWLEDI